MSKFSPTMQSKRHKYNGGSLTFKLISNSIFRDMKKCLFLGQSHFSKVLDMQASEHNSLYELAYVCILSKSSIWNYKYKLRYKSNKIFSA